MPSSRSFTIFSICKVRVLRESSDSKMGPEPEKLTVVQEKCLGPIPGHCSSLINFVECTLLLLEKNSSDEELITMQW